MKNYRIIFLLLVTISIYVFLSASTLRANDNIDKKQTALTKEQAAILASKIANGKFQKDFGFSPFKPESYTALFIGSKWHWGEISPAGVNGCSAAVTFDKDGSNEDVKIAYFIDKLMDTDIERQQIKIEKVIPRGNPEELK